MEAVSRNKVKGRASEYSDFKTWIQLNYCVVPLLMYRGPPTRENMMRTSAFIGE